jgi:hypothetical protein
MDDDGFFRAVGNRVEAYESLAPFLGNEMAWKVVLCLDFLLRSEPGDLDDNVKKEATRQIIQEVGPEAAEMALDIYGYVLLSSRQI